MPLAERVSAASGRRGARLADGLPRGRRSPRGRLRWYLIQVPEGRERSLCGDVLRLVPRDVLADAFVIMRERWMRRSGEWFTQECVMYPGFIFAVTGDAVALSKALGTLTLPVRLAAADERSWAPLADEARDWFAAAMDERHVIRSSTAVIADGALHVEEGPLVGQEDRLSGLNRHKRFCRVRAADADGGFVESVPLSVPSKS